MADIFSSAKIASFIYDVNVDGGSVGTNKPTGVYLPGNCVVVYGFAKVITTFQSNTNGNLAVGVTGTAGFFILATNYTSFIEGAIVEGNDLIRDMKVPSVNTIEMVVSIYNQVFTAGKLIYTCQYVELDD